MANVDGTHCPELLTDLEAAVTELRDRLERTPELWERARGRKWTAGQHADHVANVLGGFAGLLERAEHALRAGTLPAAPRRGLLQRAFVGFMTGDWKFPRGGRSPEQVVARPDPERQATLARLAGEVARYRPLVARLAPGERERVWIKNPFLPRFHYALPEALRVQAKHTRHHRLLIEEIARAKS
jgi:hypothetical protein